MLSAFEGIHRTLHFTTGVVIACLLIASPLMFVGCDEEEQRAISPGYVRESPTEPPEGPDRQVATPAQPNVAPLENGVLGMALPRAERVYFPNRGEIWRASVDAEPAPVLTDLNVTGYSSTATGHRLAVLSERAGSGADQRQAAISLVLPDGTSLIEVSSEDEPGLAVSPVESIALTPTGNRMALAHENGAIMLVSMSGHIEELLAPDPAQQPGMLDWSSDGQFLAYLDPWLPGEPSALYVAVPESGVRQILVRASDDGHGVIRARWVPGTSSIVFVRSSGSTIALGGDLFIVDAMSGEQQLLVPAGQFAPVAGVVDIALSPGGDWIALTTFVPGAERPQFMGLWLYSLRTGELEAVPIETGESVTDIWWLGENLLLRAVHQPRSKLPGIYTGLEEFTLLEYDLETGAFSEHHVD